MCLRLHHFRNNRPVRPFFFLLPCFLSFSLSLCLSHSLSLCHCLCLCISLSVSLSLFLSVSVSVSVSVSLPSLCFSICVCLCIRVCVCLCLSLPPPLSFCLSVSLGLPHPLFLSPFFVCVWVFEYNALCQFLPQISIIESGLVLRWSQTYPTAIDLFKSVRRLCRNSTIWYVWLVNELLNDTKAYVETHDTNKLFVNE